MAELSLGLMKSLVNDGVVGASEFTEWIRLRVWAFARGGDLAALSLALDEGADPNLADGDGNNPLIYAAKWGHEHCVARLLEAGADPNCVHSGRSVLHHAVLVSRAGAVEALLAGGASVVRTGIYKQHVLIVDAVWALGRRSHRHGSGRIIPLLLRAGAVIPEGDHWLWRSYQAVSDPASERYSRSKTRRFEYLHAVQAAAGFPAACITQVVVPSALSRACLLFLSFLSAQLRLPLFAHPDPHQAAAHAALHCARGIDFPPVLLRLDALLLVSSPHELVPRLCGSQKLRGLVRWHDPGKQFRSDLPL